MADFLDEKRKEIQARLKELKPAVDEYQLLQAADQALGGLATAAPHGRPPRARRRAAAARARRRRRQARPPARAAARAPPRR